MWWCPDYLFPVAESRGGIIKNGGHGKKIKFPAFFLKKMKACLATASNGDSGKIRPPEAAREDDVRQQATSAASYYFTDLRRLNEQKKRGAPFKEFAG